MNHEGPRQRSVILLSAGLDSAANLALCAERDEPVRALTFDYGQKAAAREAENAGRLCAHYDVPHEVIRLEWLGALGGSSLTDPAGAIPFLDEDRLDDREVTRLTARAVWVPNRNGVFIHVGAAYAERLGASRVVLGFNREEAATFPDNSAAYLESVTRALGFSTATGVIAFSYTSDMNKIEIVRTLEGLKRPFPFDLLWSCYEGADLPCGKCESCRRLERAMKARRLNPGSP